MTTRSSKSKTVANAKNATTSQPVRLSADELKSKFASMQVSRPGVLTCISVDDKGNIVPITGEFGDQLRFRDNELRQSLGTSGYNKGLVYEEAQCASSPALLELLAIADGEIPGRIQAIETEPRSWTNDDGTTVTVNFANILIFDLPDVPTVRVIQHDDGSYSKVTVLNGEISVEEHQEEVTPAMEVAQPEESAENLLSNMTAEEIQALKALASRM